MYPSMTSCDSGLPLSPSPYQSVVRVHDVDRARDGTVEVGELIRDPVHIFEGNWVNFDFSNFHALLHLRLLASVFLVCGRGYLATLRLWVERLEDLPIPLRSQPLDRIPLLPIYVCLL